MSKFILPKVNVIIDNYITPIQNKNLNDAFAKVEAIKNMTGDILEEQIRNMEEAEKLAETT